MDKLTILGVVLFLLLCGCISRGILENFRGGGHRGGHGGHHGGHGGRGHRGGRGYLHRFRRRGRGRRWYNQGFGGLFTWPSWYYNTCQCKRGCTIDGNCPVPGYPPYDCVWASDCNCCGEMYY